MQQRQDPQLKDVSISANSRNALPAEESAAAAVAVVVPPYCQLASPIEVALSCLSDALFSVCYAHQSCQIGLRRSLLYVCLVVTAPIIGSYFSPPPASVSVCSVWLIWFSVLDINGVRSRLTVCLSWSLWSVDGRLFSLDSDLFSFNSATGLVNWFLSHLLTFIVSDKSLFSWNNGFPMTQFIPFDNFVTAAFISTFRIF